MERAVESCAKTILVFTQNWFSSEDTQFEAAMLQVIDPVGAKKKVVPIRLEKVEIPLRFQIYSYYDLSDDNYSDTLLNQLIGDIKQDFKITEPAKKICPPLETQHIDIERLPQTGFELFGRSKELTLLNEAWESGDANIVSFVAYGGVGKSTLVNKWAEKMRWDNYRGAKKVYAWSFYSQGTSERVTSADMFFNDTLKWFGDADPSKGSLWDKGKRLARLINEHKTLLILDGLEPLQSGEKVEQGKIKDAALETLVRELAKYNKGLCIITTRENVPELKRYPERTKQLDLEHISDEAGRKLLEMRRIHGLDEELERIVREFGNHALAIQLLAEYLHSFEGHPATEANNIPDLDIPDKKGNHARRVIEAYANRFGSASAEFQLLSILGLFDRPVPIDAVDAIIRDNPVLGLSDKITDTSGSDWLTTLENLRKHKLLFKESEHHPDTLDCHPLIRGHFGEKLEKGNPDAWRQAHARLYEYYKSLPEKLYNKKLPDTLEEMEPLFAAVMHGCLSGKHQKAMDDVYYSRIQRDGTTNYCCSQLGAFGADLSCLSSFVERLWDKPASGLTETDKAATLSWAGFRLRAVGRLSEAAKPMKAATESAIQLKHWENAARGASTISELYLTLGDVASAQEYGAQSVTFADRSGDGFQMESKRATYADALHQAGKHKAAEELFVEAENMQKKRQPEYPWLYSGSGFRFCDLLLSIGKYQEVLERAKATIEWVKKMNLLLDIALDKLSTGKALMLQSVDSNLSDFAEAKDYLNQAVDGLREAGTQHRLPWGFLARATLSRHQKDFLKSWADLDEALEIAEYGQMRLHLTDYHLEACRNITAQLAVGGDSLSEFEIVEEGQTLSLTKEQMQARFQEHFNEAERLVEETGYHRRDAEVEELRG